MYSGSVQQLNTNTDIGAAVIHVLGVAETRQFIFGWKGHPLTYNDFRNNHCMPRIFEILKTRLYGVSLVCT